MQKLEYNIIILINKFIWMHLFNVKFYFVSSEQQVSIREIYAKNVTPFIADYSYEFDVTRMRQGFRSLLQHPRWMMVG